ncbi:Response regulator receiver domain-containing protein [Chitinophaga sp. CF118]|uniref:response regulator transcription factor n=1 Tax=Chitinophaga sp. CF118 TaxID=1884367 RepID=UPI0008EF8D78|nr:response regulator transcription factor [Chitinophaga sp. CF118]SFD82562.1 Response regulator receiver domain-containing protein [Chitinophaga sp. CF118]
MKILVAEDNPTLLKLISIKLTDEGHDVLSCANGKEALEKMLSWLPELIITDLMLPYNSGMEIIHFAKSNLKGIFIMVLSGIGQEKTIEEAFKLGADDYMRKPFNLSELSIRAKKISNTQI